MALPTHYLKKRDLLHGARTPPATLTSVGREFLEQECYSDALDFFEKARDEEGLAEIKRTALKKGDSFLLARLERFDRTRVGPEDWKQAAEQARKNGMESMAVFAERKLAPPAAAEAPKVAPGEQPLEEA